MNIWIGFGALFGGFSVILGAFGAHFLKNLLPIQKLAAFQTANQYMAIHSLALILIGVLSIQMSEAYETKLKRAGTFFTIGTILFCGSIYVLTFEGPKFFGPITPIGGLFFIIGWFLLAITFLKKN